MSLQSIKWVPVYRLFVTSVLKLGPWDWSNGNSNGTLIISSNLYMWLITPRLKGVTPLSLSRHPPVSVLSSDDRPCSPFRKPFLPWWISVYYLFRLQKDDHDSFFTYHLGLTRVTTFWDDLSNDSKRNEPPVTTLQLFLSLSYPTFPL